MLWMLLPGGVVAGVAGNERALLRPVSMDMGLVPCAPLIPCCCHWKFSEPFMLAITAPALVGGVGKVWARSGKDGRPCWWDGRGGCCCGGPGRDIE